MKKLYTLIILLLLPGCALAALNGIWKGDKGGTFYIQEDRGKIYWYAEQLSRNPMWAHVFTGERKDLFINGTWVDVPKGKRRTRGRLIADITDDEKYIIIRGAGFDATRLYRLKNKPVSADSRTIITQPPEVKEDCIAFNPSFAQVVYTDGRWRIMDGAALLFDFDRSRTEADLALKIIKHYRMNEVCHIGKEKTGLQYLLVEGKAPIGNMADDDCIVFDPINLRVEKVSGNWILKDGNQWVFDFGVDVYQAKQSLEIIRRFQFSRSCFVGRPEPSFKYLRQ